MKLFNFEQISSILALEDSNVQSSAYVINSIPSKNNQITNRTNTNSNTNKNRTFSYQNNLQLLVIVSLHLNSTQSGVKFLPTALVDIINERGEVATLRALIDPGSDDNHIVEKHAKKLKIEMVSSYQNISVLGDNSGGYSTRRARFSLRFKYNSFQLKLSAAFTEKITRRLPNGYVELFSWDYLKNLKLANLTFNKSGNIDLLLGISVYFYILENGLKTDR